MTTLTDDRNLPLCRCKVPGVACDVHPKTFIGFLEDAIAEMGKPSGPPRVWANGRWMPPEEFIALMQSRPISPTGPSDAAVTAAVSVLNMAKSDLVDPTPLDIANARTCIDAAIGYMYHRPTYPRGQVIDPPAADQTANAPADLGTDHDN